MTTFVLVPGAWLAAWAWDDVVAGLVAAGHDVHAVTLPGLGERAEEVPAASVDLSAHVADVVALIEGSGVIEGKGLHDVTLVVHSYAGALGAMIADRVPQRLGHLVYLATRPVPDGLSMFALMGTEAEQGIRAMAAAAGDPDRLPVPPDQVLDQYYPMHALTGDLLTRFRARATPHPIATQAQSVRLTGAGDTVPRRVLWCEGDGPVPQLLGVAPCEVRVLPTGHWPQLTHPQLVVSALLEVDGGSGPTVP
jgi:pimeloyl-ACP methyl ester carboxylesterase